MNRTLSTINRFTDASRALLLALILMMAVSLAVVQRAQAQVLVGVPKAHRLAGRAADVGTGEKAEQTLQAADSR